MVEEQEMPRLEELRDLIAIMHRYDDPMVADIEWATDFAEKFL